jgi:hypothetical protein
VIFSNTVLEFANNSACVSHKRNKEGRRWKHTHAQGETDRDRAKVVGKMSHDIRFTDLRCAYSLIDRSTIIHVLHVSNLLFRVGANFDGLAPGTYFCRRLPRWQIHCAPQIEAQQFIFNNYSCLFISLGVVNEWAAVFAVNHSIQCSLTF